MARSRDDDAGKIIYPASIVGGTITAVLASQYFFKRFVRRITSAEELASAKLRGRWLVGRAARCVYTVPQEYVDRALILPPSVGDADNFRLWHTPLLRRGRLPRDPQSRPAAVAHARRALMKQRRLERRDFTHPTGRH